MNKPVRVRFAPSPTGPLHIGGVRTALYNYLFARKHGGQFILRIEDTDQTRFVEGAEDYIVKSLNWAGINFDEGVHIGGPYAPYKQSERYAIYKQYADKLINDGFAYYAFDTPQQLDAIRNEYQANKQSFQYDCNTRKKLRNSLTMNNEELDSLLKSGHPYTVRFLIPENQTVIVNDLIRGRVEVNTSQLDDKVLFKSDGLPTYHLANVVDDYLMKISHVIRGEEWLPSAPLHVLLYNALGWANDMPAFAHLPLILKPEGNGKLSKRDGDRLGFPVFPLQWTDPASKEISSGYKESGYFPEAFINMLAFLGWNPGTTQELFSLDQLVEIFSLERINKAGAKFDPLKTKWFNHQYLVLRDNAELTKDFLNVLAEKQISADYNMVLTVVGLVKERVSFVKDMWDESFFFFKKPEGINQEIINKKCKENTPQILENLLASLTKLSDWQATTLNAHVHEFMQHNNLGAGQVMVPLRLCLVGELKGPDVFEIMQVLGKQECEQRINDGIEVMEKHKSV